MDEEKEILLYIIGYLEATVKYEQSSKGDKKFAKKLLDIIDKRLEK